MKTKIVWNRELEERESLKNKDKAIIKDGAKKKNERTRNKLGDNDNLR